MAEGNLKSKDASIQIIVEKILDCFGQDYFEKHITDGNLELIDFWDADLFAIGLKAREKSIYISSWDYRNNSHDNMQYYVEFELIDNETFETKQKVKEFKGINKEDIVKEMKDFFK